jgi:hypothetical protein
MNTNWRTIRREFAARCLGTYRLASLLVLLLAFAPFGGPVAAQEPADYDFHDSHFHLTNYVQEGTDIRDFVAMMGSTIGRSTVFGIPLQQQWSYRNTGDFAPTYYLQSDAPLYYYSFTDAHIAMAYQSLSAEEQARLDPMITGFNPADMYAADHIRRVLETFPGVFSGIGEFTIHKEFVSAKVAGEVASIADPALDRILDFAGEVGLVVILHSDINMPFPKPDQEPYLLAQMKALFERLGSYRGRTGGAPARRAGRHRRGHRHRSRATTHPLRHLLGRGGEVRHGDTGNDSAHGRRDQPLPRPLPVRQRRRGAKLGRSDGGGLRGVRPVVGRAHAGGQPEGTQRQLRASLRRGSDQGQGLGTDREIGSIAGRR